MAEDYEIYTTNDENLHESRECRNIDQVITLFILWNCARKTEQQVQLDMWQEIKTYCVCCIEFWFTYVGDFNMLSHYICGVVKYAVIVPNPLYFAIWFDTVSMLEDLLNSWILVGNLFLLKITPLMGCELQHCQKRYKDPAWEIYGIHGSIHL